MAMAMVTYSPRFLDSTASACPLSHMRRRSAGAVTTHKHKRRNGVVTCVGGDHEPPSGSGLLLDRRDVLMGLGGLYGAASKMRSAVANPVVPTDVDRCQTATEEGIPAELLKCCPPYKGEHLPITDYDYPQTPIRIRRPAHIVANDAEYMNKYRAAVAAMRRLDDTRHTGPIPKANPWSLINQSKVHCAMCSDGYKQSNNVPIQVHFSWFFLPWHRFYLHFYERILGKLIDDDTFALPYWNWDNPEGMPFPAIFSEINSPVYDPNRNLKHMQPPALLDLKYSHTDPRDDVPNSTKIAENLEWLRLEFRNGKSLPALFMGDPLRGGEASDAAAASGGLERIHNVVHNWVGADRTPFLDMGSFVTAARDPIFFSHHSNVDRLWGVFRQSRGNQVEFDDRDWLDSAFVFYDENRRLSRVKVRDSLDNLNFRYVYQDSPASYLRAARPKARALQRQLEIAKPFGDEPRRLDGEIKVLVPRPAKRRSAAEKEEEVEVLFVEGIDVMENNTPTSISFDVYVSTPKVDQSFAGRYVTLPHTMGGGMEGTMASKSKKRALKIGLTSLLEEMEAEDEGEVVVTLKAKEGEVTIGGISIKLVKTT